ncbi:MAG TPA: ATP-binding cassette domain-containing protein [Streptosporangiaceae bacterium]|nr:ATP-binding cassette domain-containing protein [Streptosporangiaceae bacterium]
MAASSRSARSSCGSWHCGGSTAISSRPVLAADDISFAYLGATTAALRHVDLTVAAGEVVLVTGLSGCGKSTLALALCGLIPSRVHGELRGQVSFDGRPLTGLPPHKASQLVGMVFQNPNLQLINHTVQSEVAFGPENLALPQPEIAARVDWCLDVTGMAGMRMASTVTLSGGQKQRTAIAATLAMRPRILVLDEPLSDLDPVGAQEVLGTLRRLARDEGTGVLIIEHRVDEVAPWADRVVLMDGGRIVLDHPPRVAWADEARWAGIGVGVPDVVRLAHALPDAFTGPLPLSVDDALAQVRETWLVPALAQAAAARAGLRPAPDGNGAARAPVLSWDHVTVHFGAKRAIDDVTLSIAEGEWVAMIGANGSGKSTLTGLTVGLGTPSAGQVFFRGTRVRPGRVFEHAAHVALLLQAADEMLFEETIIKELLFGSRFRAMPPHPVLTVEEAIEFFGFRGLEQTSPWELSQGGRQRLALAALLVGAPGVLVLDEPTTGQDAQRMRAFLRLLQAVRARTGLTVLTVTHDIRGLASRAARIVVLGGGRVQLDGPTSEVLARTAELETLGIIAPPMARLQTALLGPAVTDVLLSVEELAAAVTSVHGAVAGAGQLPAGSVPAGTAGAP